ncbi:MAG: hypothetical protein LBR26_14100, partial [Prevotella sp.]|nr:hypothetical protein [Prevotella sp.]
KGTSSTNTFSFTPKASTYYAITEATFTFFSPTGEFDPVTKTISVPATSGQYLPSSHGGWAGSNIYWVSTNETTGDGYLTFADMDDPQLATKERYQGVFFKWGSLVGVDPSQSYTIGSESKGATNSWTGDCRVFVPTWNPLDPSASSWKSSKASASIPVYTAWGNIPWANGQTNENKTAFAYLTMDAGASAVENTPDGGHVPVEGKSIANQKMIGDICRYLTQTGDAPGTATGTRWRMPTIAEFAVPTGIANDTDYVPTANGWGDNNAQATSPYGLIAPPDGRRKNYSHVSPATLLPAALRPFFSASGVREPDGKLVKVGYDGDRWSSSPAAENAYLFFFRGFDVTPVLAIVRPYGFPVRCVKEL